MLIYLLGWLMALRELIIKLGTRTRKLLTTVVFKLQLASESDVRLDKTRLLGLKPQRF